MPLDNPDEIVAYVAARTVANWNDRQAPLMLSFLGGELLSLNASYRDIIAPMKFREFLSSRGGGKFNIVQHPNQKAKVGLVPPGQIYIFPALDDVPSFIGDSFQAVSVRPKRSVQGKYVVQNFLDLLSDLDEADISRVVIPVDIMAKMIKSR